VDRAASPLTFGLSHTVDSTGDGHNVGSVTQCDDGTGHCTLRAAIEAANGYHTGTAGISFNIPAAGCRS
jgi:CSLREA domain-containing protein